MKPRAFTLIEVTIALGLLLSVMLAATILIGTANRRQRATWDDLQAAECAESLLERTCATRVCQVTPPQGRALPEDALATGLPEAALVLFVTRRENLLELRAVVAWQSPDGSKREVERTHWRVP